MRSPGFSVGEGGGSWQPQPVQGSASLTGVQDAALHVSLRAPAPLRGRGRWGPQMPSLEALTLCQVMTAGLLLASGPTQMEEMKRSVHLAPSQGNSATSLVLNCLPGERLASEVVKLCGLIENIVASKVHADAPRFDGRL